MTSRASCIFRRAVTSFSRGSGCYNRIPGALEEDKFIRNVEAHGFGTEDIGSPRNVMSKNDGGLQISDAGLMSYPDEDLYSWRGKGGVTRKHYSNLKEPPPGVQTETDRQRARQRRITYHRKGNT